ncbi:Armadillo-like helical [Metarhizium album ARSEF 1941]|uniref:Pumilio homology domain family member 3 n=1 Tax=Metarhizium album (strain ARSEF 1941) TaxID=1081103 RepID=A0A0B2X2U5_METAS|nr:Armadillo-like helical [Metarhizium album ARSEF 1941]KHN99610.1 Armadillo-like helical [Metarhizium album ARSEF 1941]
MPPASNDKSQHSMGSGFPGSNLYPNSNIWTASLSNARERSIGAKGMFSPILRMQAAAGAPGFKCTYPIFSSLPETEGSPSGSSALAANSEADVWGTSGPWKTEHPARSASTSPNRTRDAAMPNGSAYFDHAPSAIGIKKGSFGGAHALAGDAAAYSTTTSTLTSQKLPPMDALYMEPLAQFPGIQSVSREASIPPPSRQSQGSPAFQQDVYRGHTPSNSNHSQRAIGNQASSFSSRSVNQRAFNLNKQLDDELAYHGRRLALDNANNSSNSFNPTSQPFQFNPGSQSWMTESPNCRYENAVDADTIAAQYASIKRGPVDRIPPSPAFRLDTGHSPRNYAVNPDNFPARPSSRDPRSSETERRSVPAQHFAGGFTPSFFPGQYAFANLTTQYPQSYIDPYAQNFRNAMISGYGIHPVSSAYSLAANLPPVRPSRDQDPGKGVRSVLLDEFRLSNKSSKRYELKDIYNHLVEFSGDQHGSRFIQQKLESANSDEKDQVFREIEPNAIQLMKDVFGNYVIQKFFEHGNQVQKKVLAEKMKGKVVDLSVQVYACRVVQKALEHVLVEQQAELTKELEPDILRVIRDQNGNHVVQKIIELVPRQHINFITDAVRGQITGLASHTYGCRVIQRMLEHGTESDKAEIMMELHASAQILITDQYGNYVAQHVIQNGKPEDRAKMIELVMAQLLTLSKHKFASNVVEKCIEHGTAEQRTSVREKLTTVGSDGTRPLQQMMRDQYGNYVIQKLLGQLEGRERDMLVEEIKPQFFALKKNGSSRQLQALEKLLGLGSGSSCLKHDAAPTQTDLNSAADTPALTNETSSPQSSSPRSAHASAISIPTEESGKKTSDKLSNMVTLQVREEEA